MRIIISILFCWGVSACLAQTYPPKAIDKNNQAMVLCNFQHNKDSLNKAIGLLDEAIRISPSYPMAYMNKAQILCWLGKPEEALDVVLSVEELISQSPYLCTGKGLLYEKNRKIVEAKKAYQRSIELLRERLEVNSGNVADFMNLLYSQFLLDSKILSLEEVNSMKKTLGVKLNATDDEKLQNWFRNLYSVLERGRMTETYDQVRL